MLATAPTNIGSNIVGLLNQDLLFCTCCNDDNNNEDFCSTVDKCLVPSSAAERAEYTAPFGFRISEGIFSFLLFDTDVDDDGIVRECFPIGVADSAVWLRFS